MSNKIQVVIAKKEKPYFPFKPSLQWFKEMGIGRKRFNQILRNQTYFGRGRTFGKFF